MTLATGELQAFDCVVTTPLMSGPGLAGVPATEPDAIVPVDESGRVQGMIDVHAGGDVVDFPIKQGGLAAQQADTVAADVARSHGAGVDAAPFGPRCEECSSPGRAAVHALRRKRRRPRRLRPLVPAAAAAHQDRRRYLAPYLFGRAD